MDQTQARVFEVENDVDYHRSYSRETQTMQPLAIRLEQTAGK
jgi:hypothetical protein